MSERRARGRRAAKRARSGARGLARASVEAPIEALRRTRARSRTLFRQRPLPPGARPGTLAIAEDMPPPRIHVFLYAADRCEERAVEDVEELAALRDVAGVTWVDVQGFGDERALRRIGEIFGVHPLALADVVNVPQRPKIEDYGDRHLVISRMARLGEAGAVEFEQVSLVLGPGWLLTFQEHPGDAFDPVRERLRAGVGSLRRSGPEYLTYALLDAVVDGYFPVVEAVGESLDHLEEEVMTAPSRLTLARIHATRRMLLTLHRVQWRQRDTLNAMVRDENLPFDASVRVYLRDAHDHTVQLLDVIETYREMAVGLMDIYLSSVSNRMNEVMKTLTVMASIFIPLTLIAGIYGMNFENMPELHWRWGYYAVWGLMAGVALGLALWFRRRGWIGSSGAHPPSPGDDEC